MPLFPRLYNLAHWLTQDRAEAEDLVQETYMKALRGFSGFEPGTNFRAWIYKILRNTFLTSRTGLRATVSLDVDRDEGEEPPPSPRRWRPPSPCCWPAPITTPSSARSNSCRCRFARSSCSAMWKR